MFFWKNNIAFYLCVSCIHECENQILARSFGRVHQSVLARRHPFSRDQRVFCYYFCQTDKTENSILLNRQSGGFVLTTIFLFYRHQKNYVGHRVCSRITDTKTSSTKTKFAKCPNPQITRTLNPGYLRTYNTLYLDGYELPQRVKLLLSSSVDVFEIQGSTLSLTQKCDLQSRRVPFQITQKCGRKNPNSKDISFLSTILQDTFCFLK